MNFDAYRTIADISVALSGFIGIILVLQHRDKLFAMILFDDSGSPDNHA